MNNGGKNPDFCYWKRPWQKWLILAMAILQFLFLWMKIREQRKIFAAGIFSGPAWEHYVAQNNFQCAVHGLMAACFLGVFLIRILARSQRKARLAEGLFLLLLVLVCGAAGFALRLASLDGSKILWPFLLLLTFGAGVYDLWKYRKQE